MPSAILHHLSRMTTRKSTTSPTQVYTVRCRNYCSGSVTRWSICRVVVTCCGNLDVMTIGIQVLIQNTLFGFWKTMRNTIQANQSPLTKLLWKQLNDCFQLRMDTTTHTQ